MSYDSAARKTEMSLSTKSPAGDAAVNMQEVVEGMKVRLVPAPSLKRALAVCIDYGICTLATYLVFMTVPFALVIVTFLAGAISGASGNEQIGKVAFLITVIIYALLILGIIHSYFIYFESKSGSTPGKKLFGLRVVSVDGRKLSFSQCVIRELIRSWVDIFVLPSLIAIRSTARKQRIGDLAANTMVVYSVTREQEQRFLYVKQDDYQLLLEHLRPGPLEVALRDEYLKFAYQEFMVRLHPAPPDVIEGWTRRIRDLWPQTESLGLNQITILRFFAEYCFQDTLKEQHQESVTTHV